MAAIASDAFHATHLSGISAKRPVLIMGAETALTLEDDDTGAIVFALTTASVIALPKIADVGPGWFVTVINEGADGVLITLSPNAADGFEGEIATSGADSHPTGAADSDLINTGASAIKGDRVTIVADGGTHWYVIEGVGVWVSG